MPYAVGIVSNTIWIVKALIIIKLYMTAWAYWLTPAHDNLQTWVNWLSARANQAVLHSNRFSYVDGSFWQLPAHANSFVLVWGGTLLAAWFFCEVLGGTWTTTRLSQAVQFKMPCRRATAAWNLEAGSKAQYQLVHKRCPARTDDQKHSANAAAGQPQWS